jgi:hypothetical protein
VKAWVLASHIARRIHEAAMLPRGNEKTDQILERIAGGMPPSSHAVLVESQGDDDPLAMLGPQQDGPLFGRIDARVALEQFLDVAQHAYALGTAQQRTPVKRGQSRALAGLAIQLQIPRGRDGRWHARLRIDQELDQAKARQVVDEAGAIWTPLNRVVLTAWQEPLELSVDEASALIMAAPDLMATGAGVELPEELTLSMERQVKARIRFRDGDDVPAAATPRRRTPGTSAGPRFRLEELVAYDIDVALGGQDVDAEEIRKIARQAGALVQLGGEWVQLDDTSREQLERLARAVEATDSHMANSAALSAALGGEAVLPGGIRAEVERVDEASLARAVEFLRNPAVFEDVAAPEGFTGELRPYQQKGLTWLAGMSSLPLGAVLADDMGLGKTVQVIALIRHLRNEAVAAGEDPEAVLASMRPMSRDNARTPMQWDGSEHAGFTTGEPWIPVNPNHTEINAEAARADPDSVFHHYRRLIELRRSEPVIAHGDFRMLLPDDERVYAFTRRLGDVELLVLGNVAEPQPGVLAPWEARVHRRRG